MESHKAPATQLEISTTIKALTANKVYGIMRDKFLRKRYLDAIFALNDDLYKPIQDHIDTVVATRVERLSAMDEDQHIAATDEIDEVCTRYIKNWGEEHAMVDLPKITAMVITSDYDFEDASILAYIENYGYLDKNPEPVQQV